MEALIEKLNQSLDWTWLAGIKDYTVEQAIRLQQIPAPTFAEKERATYVMRLFEDFQLHDVRMDEVFNVYGRLPGTHATQPAVMISAHTDTVFADGTDLTYRHEDHMLHGPGMGDNCFGLGGLLGLIAALRQAKITPACDIWFVAPSREEGLGDLGGMKAAFEALSDRVGCVINLEGLAFGHIYHAGIAVRRLHITAQAEGGHSWLHFGRPSAVHAIVNLGARITALEPARHPRTTYNIGMIEGGQGINVIASSAGLWLDMRAEDREALAVIEQQVRALVDEMRSADLKFNIEVVGDRPAGSISPQHPLVTGALAALAQVGMQGVLETGSTDGNVPLAAGCPAVTIGITRGGNAHRLDEFVELEYVEAGLRQLILLALAATGTQIP